MTSEGNPAKLTQPQRAHRPGAGKLGLHQPPLPARAHSDKEDERAALSASGHREVVLWPPNKELPCLPASLSSVMNLLLNGSNIIKTASFAIKLLIRCLNFKDFF